MVIVELSLMPAGRRSCEFMEMRSGITASRYTAISFPARRTISPSDQMVLLHTPGNLAGNRATYLLEVHVLHAQHHELPHVSLD